MKKLFFAMMAAVSPESLTGLGEGAFYGCPLADRYPETILPKATCTTDLPF